MKIFLYIQIILICNQLIFVNPIFCQDYNLDYENITVSEGLSDNYILCMIQDQLGFIWMGTENGLNRFDGYNVKTFYHDEENPQSLSDNYITTLYQHPSGLIWIGTKNGGLNIFDPISETFTRVSSQDEKSETLIHQYITAICPSVFGGIWIGTQGGLQYITTTNTGYPLEFQSYLPDPNDPSSIHTKEIYCLLETSDSTLWIGSNNFGLGRKFPPKNGKPTHFVHYPHGTQATGLVNGAVMTIFEDSKQRVWVGNWKGGLNLYIPEKDNFISFLPQKQNPSSINNENVYSVCEDHLGDLWIGTYGGGLSRIVPVDQTTYNYHFEPFNFDHLAVDPVRDYRIRTILMDRSGVLWAGSLGGGVKKVVKKPQQFFRFDGNRTNQHDETKFPVTALMVDSKDKIWVGLENQGLHCYEVKDSTYELKLLNSYHYDPNKSESLLNNLIHVIYEDASGNIWVGTESGLNCLKKDGNYIEAFTHGSSNIFGLTNNKILSISEDRNGRLWIGTKVGLNLFDPITRRFINYRNNYSYIFEFTEEDDIDIFSQTKSGVYIAGGNWFFGQIDSTMEEGFFHWEAGKLESEFLRYRVHCIWETNDKKLWIGTQKGLSLYDSDSGFVQFNGMQALVPYMINSIQEDYLGFLWLGTPAGLLRFDPETGNLTHHHLEGRAPNNDFVLRASAMTSNGIAFMGTSNGLVYFKPAQLHPNNYFPSVIINDFRISNRSVPVGINKDQSEKILEKAIYASSDVNLPYTNDVFTLEFVVLSHFQQDEYQYAYRLEGVNDAWNYTNAQNRSVTYAKLSPGTYTFQVKAANNDGLWAEDIRTLNIHIQPPWWKTETAYFFYLTLLVLLIYTSKQYTRKRIELENELRMQKLEQEKTQEIHQMKVNFFTNISHELRTPLTLILTPLERLLKDSSDKNMELFKLMYRNTHKLLRLVNQLIDFQKQEAGKLKLQVQKRDVAKFVEKTIELFYNLAQEKNITLHFNSNKQQIFLWFDPDQLEKILYNLLSNALKFTNKDGNIYVALYDKSATVEIIVKDNGIGINSKDLPHIFERFYQSNIPHTMQMGTGIGLAFSKHLVELHHGSIKAESIEEKGAKFTVSLLKGNTHFPSESIVDSQKQISYKIIEESGEPTQSFTPVRPSSSHASSSPKILVVEDNTELRAYLKHMLIGDYRIKTAEDAQKGLKMSLKENPDLIISDVMMPGMNGWEFCEKIKTDIRTSHIPFILLTAKTCHTSKIKGLEAGADDYLSKPFHAEELNLKVRNLLETRFKFKAYFRRTFTHNEEPDYTSINTPDQQFLEKAKKIVEQNLSDPQYEVNRLVKDIGMSRSLIYTKFPKLTGYSPNDYIKMMRLRQAAVLLQMPEWSIGNVSIQVGFKTTKYFSKCFKAYFGMTPTEYKEQFAVKNPKPA